jgi:hypothetical protein
VVVGELAATDETAFMEAGMVFDSDFLRLRPVRENEEDC